MGYTKKEVVTTQQKKETPVPQAPKKVVTIMRTLEEKKQCKQLSTHIVILFLKY